MDTPDPIPLDADLRGHAMKTYGSLTLASFCVRLLLKPSEDPGLQRYE